MMYARSVDYKSALLNYFYLRMDRMAHIWVTPGKMQSKMLIPSTNERISKIFRNRIFDWHLKWQSKTLFLAIFDPRLSIVKSFFDCRLPGVWLVPGKRFCSNSSDAMH